MSALTLLSFLFFLNILQQCLKDHMMAMNPQVAVMSAAREEIQPKQLDEIKMETIPASTNVKFLTVTGVGRAYASESNEKVESKSNFESQKFSMKPSKGND